MAKKSKNQLTEIDSIILPVVQLGTNNTDIQGRNTLIGKEVTLNQKMETYFKVGNFVLTDTQYTAEIPDFMTDDEYRVLSNSIRDGILQYGNHLIPPVDKLTEVLTEYATEISIIASLERNKAVKQKILNLYRRGSDRNWSAYEILSYCLDVERKSKKRKEIIDFLQELIVNFQGPKVLYTPPEDLTSDKNNANNTAVSPYAEELLKKLLSTRK